MQQYFPRECDIPSEDSLQERLDALKQTPTEDNHDSDEIVGIYANVKNVKIK